MVALSILMQQKSLCLSFFLSVFVCLFVSFFLSFVFVFVFNFASNMSPCWWQPCQVGSLVTNEEQEKAGS